MACARIRLDQDDALSDALQHAFNQVALSRSFGSSKYKDMMGVIAVQQVVLVILRPIEAWDDRLGECAARADEVSRKLDFVIDRESQLLKVLKLIMYSPCKNRRGSVELFERGLIRHNTVSRNNGNEQANECDFIGTFPISWSVLKVRQDKPKEITNKILCTRIVAVKRVTPSAGMASSDLEKNSSTVIRASTTSTKLKFMICETMIIARGKI